MGTKVKFYEFSSFKSPDLKSLELFLKSKIFSEEKTSGFLLDDLNANSLVGRFVRKNKYADERVDPFGRRYLVEIIDYDEVTFRVSVQWPHIEIYNNFRIDGLLLNRIAEAFKFDRTLLPLEFGADKLFSAIKKNFKGSIVESLLVSEIKMSDKAVARMHIEGSEDVRKILKEVLGERKFKILSSKVSWSSDGAKIKFKYDHNGKMELTGNNRDEALALLRSTVKKAFNRA